MERVRSSQPALAGLVPYDPKYLPADVMISANENPSSVPIEVERAVLERLQGFSFNRYPDPLANDLRDAIAEANGVSRANVLVGNGGDELLFNLALAWGGPGRTFLNVPPTFSVYAANAALTGTAVVDVPRKADFSIDEEAVLARLAQGDVDFAIITSPNNPTGDVAREEFLLKALDTADALILVDEAYCEFAGATMASHLREHKNLAILRTFSKAYALAGVRLGYLLAHEDVISEFLKVRQPYSVDAVSQVIGRTVVENRALFEPGIAGIVAERDRMLDTLRSWADVEAFDSRANYILVRMEDAGAVWQALYDRGVLVRDFSRSARLEGCLRITVGTKAENARLLETLRAVLDERKG